MMRSFLVVFVCCVGLSVAREFDLLSFHQECGRNEVPARCVNPCPPQRTCQDRENYLCLAVVVPCQFQCRCKEGFIRKTEGGECIPEVECGPYCGRDLVYTACKQSCLNETCSAIKNPSNCVSEEPCQPGCTCKDGYFRDREDSPCIPVCLCPEMQDSPDCLDEEGQYKFMSF